MNAHSPVVAAGLVPLRRFVDDFTRLLDDGADEAAIVARGGALLARLVARDDWLPGEYAEADRAGYRQYLLYRDPAARFSVVSFVWGPGQATPVHDHRTWGLVGVLRGAEHNQAFVANAGGLVPAGPAERLGQGSVAAVAPSLGDIHRVANAYADRISISIHVYGGDIGAIERATYDADGRPKRFVSGYAAAAVPDLGRPVTTAAEVRAALLAGREIALIDLRSEDAFAQGHPLFAVQLPPDRIELEARPRLPRRDVRLVLYDDGEGLVDAAADRFAALGYTAISVLDGGLDGWRAAGFELFRDVNSYSKAFGELVEARRGTPHLDAAEVRALIDRGADMVVLDARRFDEYATMSLPGGVSVPGAELVLRAPELAPDPGTLIVVNCAGRTRSIIGAQSLINARLPNRVVALRNGTIGWTLAGDTLATRQDRRAPDVAGPAVAVARDRARAVADRAGVGRIDPAGLAAFAADATRTLYRFDVRTPEEFARGHIPGFRSAPGGQLVQETDHFAAVRGARIVLADDLGARADMTASWLAQMGWAVFVLDTDGAGGFDGPLVTGDPDAVPPRGPEGRYRRPYEGTDNPAAAMQAYLDWEYGLVGQLARDGTHGFNVL